MKITYVMEVLINVGPGFQQWRAVKPTNGKPYEYETRNEAMAMLRTCYPDEVYGQGVRVNKIEVD